MEKRVKCKYALLCTDQAEYKYLCHNQNEAIKYCLTYPKIAGYKKIK